MKQEYARVSVEMPENDTKKILRQELTYEVENPDIKDEYTVKFWWFVIVSYIERDILRQSVSKNIIVFSGTKP